MVNDVSNTKVRNNRGNMNQQQQMQQENDGKMVDAFTVLQWHEQRINVMEENINNIPNTSGENKNDIFNSLVETIEALDKKLELLSNGYDNLVNQVNIDKKEIKDLRNQLSKKEVLENDEDEDEDEDEEIKSNVKKELNTVKLNITEN